MAAEPRRPAGASPGEADSSRQAFALAVSALLGAVGAGSVLFDGFYEYSLWGAVALAVLALVVAALLVQPFEITRLGAIALGALAVLLGWAALSLTWADSVDRAWTEVDRLALYAAVFTLTAGVARTASAARLGIAVAGAAALGVAGYIIVRLLAGSGAEMFFSFRLHQPLGYINGQAGFFVMVLWIFVAAAERARTPVGQGLSLAAAALLANLAVLSQSRAAALAAVITAALLVIALPGRVRRAWMLVALAGGVAVALPQLFDVYAERKTSTSVNPSVAVTREAAVAALLGAAAAGAAWAAVATVGARLGGRIPRRLPVVALIALAVTLAGFAVATVGNPSDEARKHWRTFTSTTAEPLEGQRFTDVSGFRYQLWRIAVNQFKAEPVTGVGAGNYASTYYKERPVLNFVRQPHSIEVQMLGELGIVGALAFLIFIGAVLVSGGWRRGTNEGPTSDITVRTAALGIFVAWLAYTSVDWLYNLPGPTMLALFAAGVLVAAPLGARSKSERRQKDKLVLLVSLVVLAVAAASIGRHYGATLYRERAEDKLRAAPQAALSDARRSLSLNPHDVSAYYVLAAAQARFDRYEEARRTLRAGARREPFNYVPWVLLGDLATRRGDLAQARRDYARAKVLNPFEPLIRPSPG